MTYKVSCYYGNDPLQWIKFLTFDDCVMVMNIHLMILDINVGPVPRSSFYEYVMCGSIYQMLPILRLSLFVCELQFGNYYDEIVRGTCSFLQRRSSFET